MMPEAPADTASQAQRGPQATRQQGPGQGGGSLMTELKVSGHLMTLESGLFCIVQTPAKGGEPGSGLPGVRLSLPPGAAGRPDSVTISGFRPDGWLSANGDAALVRVSQGPAQLLVTIYQSQAGGEGSAPNIQVMRLLEWSAAAAGRPAPRPAEEAPPAPLRAPAPARTGNVMEMVAHIQERGDVGAMLGDWLGERGSKRWIEGFGLSPTARVAPKDIEYQAVLGQGWLSPWVEGGQFCGSRAMALPLLGLRVRLRGAAAATYDVLYSATFIDGTAVGPVTNGEACESDSLAAMEAFQVVVQARRGEEAGAAPPSPGPEASVPGPGGQLSGAAARSAREPEKGKAKKRATRPPEPEPAPAPKGPAGRRR